VNEGHQLNEGHQVSAGLLLSEQPRQSGVVLPSVLVLVLAKLVLARRKLEQWVP